MYCVIINTYFYGMGDGVIVFNTIILRLFRLPVFGKLLQVRSDRSVGDVMVTQGKVLCPIGSVMYFPDVTSQNTVAIYHNTVT